MVSEKKLRIEMAIINKMIKENEMSIKWTEESKRLAVSLTKGGVSTVKLNVKLSTGKIQEYLVDDLMLLMLSDGLH